MVDVAYWSCLLSLAILEIILIKKLTVRLKRRKTRVEVIDYTPPEEKSYKIPIILLIVIALISAFIVCTSIAPFLVICSAVLA